MTTMPENTTYCDKCGGDLTPANLVNSVIVSVMVEGGEAVQLHYCLAKDAERGTKNCGKSTVVSATNLKAWQEKHDGQEFKLFHLDGDAQ